MKKFDYLTKEEVKTLLFSTCSLDRMGSKMQCINGRWYEKYGTYQAVTFCGKVFKVKNSKTKMNEYVLLVGMSKQHPNDPHIDKKLAIEIAVENSLINPFAVINLNNPNINNFMFKEMMLPYYNAMDLKFVRTREEIESLDNEKWIKMYKNLNCCNCTSCNENN